MPSASRCAESGTGASYSRLQHEHVLLELAHRAALVAQLLVAARETASGATLAVRSPSGLALEPTESVVQVTRRTTITFSGAPHFSNNNMCT